MRRLMWFSIGYIAADFLCVKYLWNTNFSYLIWILLMLSAIGLLAGRKHNCILIAGWLLLGIAACAVRVSHYQNAILAPLYDYDGKTLPLTVTALDYSEPSRYSNMVVGQTQVNGKAYRILVYLSDDMPDLSPGDEFEGVFRLRITAPGGLKESSYYQGSKTFLIGSQKEAISVLQASKITLYNLPVIINAKIHNIIDGIFPEDTAPFAKALLLGDTDFLDYETDTALKISGTRHLVAVSGLHIGFLYALIIKLLGRKRFITPLAVITVLISFAAIVGFTPSVCRACIMTAILALEWSFDRVYDSPTALSFACLTMICINPFAVLSVGLQLSAASVIGILAFQGKIHDFLTSKMKRIAVLNRFSRGMNMVILSVSMSVSTLITTVPLCAFYFHMVSLVSILTNLLIVWIASCVFAGIMFACAVGFVNSAAARIIAAFLSVPIRFITGTASFFADFPLAAVYTQSIWIIIWLVFIYTIGFYCILYHRRKGICALVGIAALVLAVLLSWELPKLDSARLTAVYVGEGQSLILQSKGRSMLIDCGGNYDQSAADSTCEMLLSQGVFKLDAIALTHYDRDHTGGIPYLLTRIPAETIFCPDMEDHGFLEQIQKENIVQISQTSQITFGDGIITMYTPGNLKTENENSMCILFDSAECDILITGDRGRSGEKRLLKEEMIPDVDVLVAGHHGSKNSVSEELLEASQPETVLISCGRNNSYGHPAQELLDRLEKYHCTVYRTDLQGNILVRR